MAREIMKYMRLGHFGENVRQIFCGTNVLQCNDSFFHLVSQIVEAHSNVLTPPRDHEILRQGNAALVVLPYEDCVAFEHFAIHTTHDRK